MTEVEAWHWVREDGCLNYPPHQKVEVGETLRLVNGLHPVLCERGFHASLTPLDALRYAPRTKELHVCRVRIGGVIVRDTDKLVASERTVLWMAPARDALVRWALWAATGSLLGRAVEGRTVDPRSWAAIETATTYLDGKTTLAQVLEARATAADAAAAAYAYADAADAYAYAAAAAYAAAYAAATDAADAAAAAAAYATDAADAYATGAQARSLLNDELENRLWLLAPSEARSAREVRP